MLPKEHWTLCKAMGKKKHDMKLGARRQTIVPLPSLPTRRFVKALKQGCDRYSLVKKGVIPKLRHSNDTKCWQVTEVNS